MKCHCCGKDLSFNDICRVVDDYLGERVLVLESHYEAWLKGESVPIEGRK